MEADLRERLSHVLWIGGATDSGKTSVARALAKKYRLPVYHYDLADLRQHQRLAENSPTYAAFLHATIDERWVRPEPEELAERAWLSFSDRFPLVLEELTALSLPEGMRVLAEGFGLTPDLIAPLLTSPKQAIWFVPTDAFKRASMQRRRKTELGGHLSNPERAAHNLLQRDRLLTERMKAEAAARGMTVIEIDGSQTVDALAAVLADRFGL